MAPVFRFAPSPNGALHLGHALSALINFEAARRTGGRFLLRLEDIDTIRCTKAKVDQMLEDLSWLGLEWEEPVVRQSERFSIYSNALASLKERDLVFPSTASRKDILNAVVQWEQSTGRAWAKDPDGALLYPRALLSTQETTDGDAAWRLDMETALNALSGKVAWQELTAVSSQSKSPGTITADPSRWGDVILARKDCPTSYHLSVVLDDVAQGITHVVRGQDLYEATSLHRLLQQLLGLPAPLYHHHRLLTDALGEKLSKSRGDLSLKTLRDRGFSPEDIRKTINFTDADLSALINH